MHWKKVLILFSLAMPSRALSLEELNLAEFGFRLGVQEVNVTSVNIDYLARSLGGLHTGIGISLGARGHEADDLHSSEVGFRIRTLLDEGSSRSFYTSTSVNFATVLSSQNSGKFFNYFNLEAGYRYTAYDVFVEAGLNFRHMALNDGVGLARDIVYASIAMGVVTN